MIDGEKSMHWSNFMCPLCGANQTEIYKIERDDLEIVIEEFNCKRCGTFYADYDFFDNGLSLEEFSLVLHYHLLNRKRIDNDYVYTLKKIKSTKNLRWINPQSLIKYLPVNKVQLLERTLLNLYLYFGYDEFGDLWRSQYLLERLSFQSEEWSSDEEILEKIKQTFDILNDNGYLKKINKYESLYTYKLTLDGAKKADSILNNIGYMSLQVFVAMSFAERGKKRYDAIRSAIEECGYTALRIDEKEHNRLIVPEIKQEIEKSDFVVVELMDHKLNVYYEAGFAEGKGKEVIYTCHKEEFNVADNFDIKQVNTVLYTTEEELKEKLVQRISETISSNQNIHI